jgi:hypothetical protein
MAEAVKKPRKLRANSKAAKIRAYLKRHPNAGPTETATALKKRGIQTSAAQVSNVKAGMKRKLDSSGEAAANGAPGRRGRKPGANDVVSLGSLIEARAFAARVGGLEKATRLLAALTKLQG